MTWDHERKITRKLLLPADYQMGRSSGFNLGGTYSSHRQQQQQHVPSVQNNGPPGLRPVNPPNSVSGMGSYDQLIQKYQQLQSQSQFRLQQMSAVGQSYRDQNVKVMQTVPDRFGLLGVSSVIKLSNPELNSFALGTDLTTLGLNLSLANDIHKKFASPWSDDRESSNTQCQSAIMLEHHLHYMGVFFNMLITSRLLSFFLGSNLCCGRCSKATLQFPARIIVLYLLQVTFYPEIIKDWHGEDICCDLFLAAVEDAVTKEAKHKHFEYFTSTSTAAN
ncbi:hypothetical protein NE237_005385 [Protea cynaroides]|uniref:CCR4-NOT transcription complex subunit 2 n=1 Tax=Protea cynaroides TaxID=273540 RepID=A0A9Q0KL87_9MAGN|nr:hypothetical protein NE237_005385 [Protea cynaroides]